MELKDMIDAGYRKVGSMKALGELLDMHPNNLTGAKAGQRGITPYACGKLADLLEIDRFSVVAASELVTERNDKKRRYLAPFALKAAQTLCIVAVAPITLFVNGPSEALAAAGHKSVLSYTMPIIGRWKRRIIAAMLAGIGHRPMLAAC